MMEYENNYYLDDARGLDAESIALISVSILSFVLLFCSWLSLLRMEDVREDELAQKEAFMSIEECPTAGVATELVYEAEISRIALLEAENELLIQEVEVLNQMLQVTDEEWECLYRVARSEAGGEGVTDDRVGDIKEGQQNVVYTVLNRVHSEVFPDTIEEVVKASGQFSVVSNGSYYKVEITEFTIQNVREAYFNYYMYGENAQGALYFRSDGKDFIGLKSLFVDAVGHEFYTHEEE